MTFTEEELNNVLPLHARKTIKRIFLYLFKILPKYLPPRFLDHLDIREGVLEEVFDYLRDTSNKSDSMMLRYIVSDGLGREEVSEFFSQLGKSAVDLNFYNIKEWIDQSDVPPLSKVLDLIDDDSVDEQEIERRAVLTFSWEIITNIFAMARREKELLKSNSSFFVISKELGSILDDIILYYEFIKVAPTGFRIITTDISSHIKRTKGGLNSKRNKEPIFEGFIEWAMNLPTNHMFRYTKHAAEYYLDVVLVKSRPDLCKLVQKNTVTTLGKRLKEFCIENNCDHPIESR